MRRGCGAWGWSGTSQRSARIKIDEAIAQPGKLSGSKDWLLALTGDSAGAERAYIASLDWARTQQAKSWELRSATSYAKLMRDQGRPGEARELLAPIYAWFTEGFATNDLKDAKALLDELADAPVLAGSAGFLTSSAGAAGGKALGNARSPAASTDRNSA